MTEFLLELLSEEIPARMQLKAATDLKIAFEEKLKGAELPFDRVETYITPRRLTAVISGIALSTQGRSEERRGPRSGAPEAALQGFIKGAGITKEDCVERDGYWYATLQTPPQKAENLLPEMIRTILKDFSWAKSMRWAGASQTWVRPLRGVMAVLDGKLLSFDLPEFQLTSTNQTLGHRFLSTGSFPVTTIDGYRQKLLETKVILDHKDRQKFIDESLESLGKKRGYFLEKDEKLLQEVAGLAEFPQPLLGEIDVRFLALPKVVLSTSMRVHQKYFTFVDAQGKIAPVFGVVANTIPSDDGSIMLKGYQKVLTARLRDAEFFYDHDLKIPLVDCVPKLSTIVFHAKLGTLGQRVERFQALVDQPESKRAALLCKADLVSSMVGEFPELQGIMGEIYARAQGESPEVAAAIREHYQPLGPTDDCPTAPVSWELSLAEKIDTLVGFFAIGEIPTGSKDPYALRRAALGVIRLLREGKRDNRQAYGLRQKIHQAYDLYAKQGAQIDRKISGEAVAESVIQFILDRLSPALRSEGIRHDAITAVLSSPNCGDDIWSIVERAKALNDYLSTESGLALQAAFRRAHGILIKDGQGIDYGTVKEALFSEPVEGQLHGLLIKAAGECQPLLDRHDYRGLMGILADLRTPIDQFFEVKINHEDPAIRNNRFGLLGLLVSQVNAIADFTKLEG